MKRTTNLLFAILLWLVSSTPVMTQTVNTNRFISINVVKGQQIKLDFAADQAATPVKIVSGSGEYNPTVGTSWSGMQNYLADDSVMTVYGDITKFDCSGNYNNVTGIDLSHNTIITWFSCGKNSLQDLIVSSNKALKELYCYNNSIKTLNLDSTTELTKLSCARNSISSLDLSHNKKLKWLNCSDNRLTGLDVSSNILLEKIICHKNNSLSTQALDRLYCSLPDRTGTFSGYIEPIYDDSSPNDSVVLATNSQNALDKNWKVKYAFDETDIPATTGSYACTTLHDSVNMDSYIKLNVVRDSVIKLNFAADQAATPIMIVSGSNKYNLTIGTSWVGIQNYLADDDVMTIYGDITKFNCSGNGNNIHDILNVAADTILTELICTDNNISLLNISRNTQLRKLNCARNNIIALNDLANNVNLTSLDCSNNLLARLDVSANFLLEKIICHGNIISSNTRLLDIIYCLLPDRSVKTTGYIQPLYDDRSSDLDSVLATNSLNAFNKNWKVSYASDSTDVSPTTGSYVCTEVDTTRYIYLEVKPNETLKLEFLVDNIDDIITIVSGKNSKTFRGNFSIGQNYDCTFTPDSTSMIIYGNVNELNCIGNGDKITALDISHNSGVTRLMCDTNNIAWLNLNGQALTFLTCSNNRLTNLDVGGCLYLNFLNCSDNQINDIKYLNTLSNLNVLICNDNRLTSLIVNSNNSTFNSIACENNNFSSTQAFDDLFCSLPPVSCGYLSIIYDSLSNGHTELLASNKYNAIRKDWIVMYASDSQNIPHTTGTYSCPNTFLDTIVLGVQRGKYIKLRFASEFDHSQARVISGSTDTIIQIDTVWTDTLRVMADADSMIILSNIRNINRFSCRDNGENILSIYISESKFLEELDCANNNIRNLSTISSDYLSKLDCSNNQIKNLYVNTGISTLNCAHNQIETLFVRDIDSSLEELDCSDNLIDKLDISNNEKITYLNCSGNNISVLSLSNNPYIETLICARNNITSLDLMSNDILESVDLSNNPQFCNLNISDTSVLKRISLYGCNFSSCGLDSVFRALPRRLPTDSAVIFIKDSTATNPGADGCRDTIASHRNWAVLNFKGNNSMDTIKNSFYTCVPNMNLNRAIRLGVVSGQTISVAIKAAANNTHIRFTCGSTDTILTVDTSWSYWQLPAKADNMVFFGDITRFNCNTNGNNITAISTKTNTILEELRCIGNSISALDLSHNVELSELYCLGNRLTSLDLSHNHKLTELACYDNPQLQHIDVNGCYPLSRVVVYGCNLSDCGLDSLLRALPRRSSDNKGKIFIKDGTSTNPGSGGCQDTIASHKNWVVLDYNGGSPDTIANTHYTCADTPTDNDRHLTNETDIKIYPNPVADILYLSATASTIHIYDIYGIEVARATDTDKVGVSHLPDGVYIVRADGTVAKMVKQ